MAKYVGPILKNYSKKRRPLKEFLGGFSADYFEAVLIENQERYLISYNPQYDIPYAAGTPEYRKEISRREEVAANTKQVVDRLGPPIDPEIAFEAHKLYKTNFEDDLIKGWFAPLFPANSKPATASVVSEGILSQASGVGGKYYRVPVRIMADPDFIKKDLVVQIKSTLAKIARSDRSSLEDFSEEFSGSSDSGYRCIKRLYRNAVTDVRKNDEETFNEPKPEDYYFLSETNNMLVSKKSYRNCAHENEAPEPLVYSDHWNEWAEEMLIALGMKKIEYEPGKWGYENVIPRNNAHGRGLIDHIYAVKRMNVAPELIEVGPENEKRLFRSPEFCSGKKSSCGEGDNCCFARQVASTREPLDGIAPMLAVMTNPKEDIKKRCQNLLRYGARLLEHNRRVSEDKQLSYGQRV